MGELIRCIHCDCFINPAFGEDAPVEHANATGTQEDPRAPGCWDNVCDVCSYGRGLRGGPSREDK